MPKLRLLEVNVQAVIIEDDGQALQKNVTQVLTIPAGEWTAFTTPGGGFDQELVRLQALADEQAPPPPAEAGIDTIAAQLEGKIPVRPRKPAQPNGNRAQRRSKAKSV